MRDLSVSLKGTIISVVVCLCIVLQDANCQSHGANNVYLEYSEVQQRPSAGKPYGTDNIQHHGGSVGYHSLPDVNDKDQNKWRTPESSAHHGGGSSNAALTDVTGAAVNGGGPVVVRGGSVVLRPSAEGFVVDGGGTYGKPEAAEVQLVQQPPLSAILPYDAAGDGVLQFGPPQHLHPFGHPFFRASGLLQWLLFGKTIFGPTPLGGYSPLCSRLAAVGRFLLDRVFEPLFATGFFMAASYLFRTSVLPRIAHYIHVYAMMKDHADDGRFTGGRQISGYLDVVTAAVNDAVNDDRPCFQRIVCEAGLRVASSPVARSARRMAKIIISKHELAHIFKESFTGSVSECNQYMCKIHAKFRFFQQALVVNGRTVGVIFAKTDAIEKYREDLGTVTLVGIDATFKTVPRVPADLKCFLTIQVVFKSVSFPMVYDLLGSMTEEVYAALFDIVRNILPLNYQHVCFITDCEKALMSAVQQSFPESQLRCCWFRFTQSIVRYCHRKMNSVLDLVRTNPVAARILRMILALPYLPATRNDPRCPQFSMADGFSAIMHYTRQFPAIEQEKLTVIENQSFVEFDQARRNLRIRDEASRRERENTTIVLADHVQQLNRDGDLIGFLRRAGHCNDAYVQGIIGPYPQMFDIIAI